jgi:hypothetical protein
MSKPEPLDIDTMETRAVLATPGPWEVEHDRGGYWTLFGAPPVIGEFAGKPMVGHAMQLISASRKSYYPNASDEALIVNARQDILALVNEVRYQRRTNRLLDGVYQNILEDVRLIVREAIEDVDQGGNPARICANLQDLLDSLPPCEGKE